MSFLFASSPAQLGNSSLVLATKSRDDPKDRKDTCAPLPIVLSDLRRIRMNVAMARSAGRGGRNKNAEIKIDLFFLLNIGTTAGTAYNSVFGIAPGSSSEYSSLAALYDECIVDGGNIHFTMRNNVAYTTDTGPDLNVWAFDPLDVTSLGSTVNGMQHSQHYLFGPSGQTLGPISNPTPVSRSGLHHWAWKTPSGSARRVTPTTQFGHDWSDTQDTTQVYGYLKPYFPSQGATGTFAMIVYLTLHCRFRCRS